MCASACDASAAARYRSEHYTCITTFGFEPRDMFYDNITYYIPNDWAKDETRANLHFGADLGSSIAASGRGTSCLTYLLTPSVCRRAEPICEAFTLVRTCMPASHVF